MAQTLATDFPIDPATTSGTMLADILNRQAEAVQTSNSGPTEPPETYPGLVWLDTSASADGILKIRNGLNTAWLDYFATVFTPANAAAARAALDISNHEQVVVDGAGDISVPGDVLVTGALQATSVSIGTPALSQDATNVALTFAAGGWGFVYTKATGALTWARSGATADLTLAANGDLNTNGGTVFAGSLNASSNATVTGGVITLGTAGSAISNFGYTVRNYNTSGSLVFANILDAQPAGLQMVLSLQHLPGSYAHAQFQIGAASFNMNSSHDAQKSGGSTAWTIVSDRRAKDGIVDYTGGLAQILSLRTRRFRYKADPSREYIGIVADEAEPGMPEIITTGYGIVDGEPVTDFKNLFIDPVIWSLVNAVKTLTARIEALESAP